MPKKAFHKQSSEKKEELMRKAMQLYVDYPYEKITLQMLLDTMELNPATFYRYFDDKDELYFYMQKLYYDRCVDYLKENGHAYETIFLNYYEGPLPVNDLEWKFIKTLLNLPWDLIWRFYSQVSKEELISEGKAGLRRLRLEGKLRANVDEDIISYMYATASFNLIMFYREYGIDDPDIQTKLKKYFFTDFFSHGILAPDHNEKQ